MHSIRSSQKGLARSGDHEDSSSPQQRFRHRTEVPQSVMCVRGEPGRKIARFLCRCHPFAYAPMKYSVKLRESPGRSVDPVSSSNQFTNSQGIRFIPIKLNDVAGVEIHGGYRWRSSSILAVVDRIRLPWSRSVSGQCGQPARGQLAFLPPCHCRIASGRIRNNPHHTSIHEAVLLLNTVPVRDMDSVRPCSTTGNVCESAAWRFACRNLLRQIRRSRGWQDSS